MSASSNPFANTDTGKSALLGQLIPGDKEVQALDANQLLQLFGESIWIWTILDNQMSFSSNIQNLLGYPAGEWGTHIDEWFSRIHADDVKSAMQAMRACVDGRSAQFQDEYRMLCSDGSWKWVRARGVVLAKSETNKALRMQGTLAALPVILPVSNNAGENHQRGQQVLENLSRELPKFFFYQFQRFPGGRCCLPYASDAIANVHGVAASEVLDNAASMFAQVHPDDLEHLREAMKYSAQTLQAWHLDYRIVLKQGERYLSGEACPTKQPDGSVIWHGFLVDVSERKFLEQHVSATDAQIHAALKCIRLGSYDIHIPSGQGQFSREYAEVLGLPADYRNHTEKFWQFFWLDSLHPDDAAGLKSAYQQHFKSQGKIPFRAEFRLRAKNGDWRWLLSIGSVVEWDSNGRAVRMLGTHVDITERKKHEMEVRHFEDILRSGRDRYKKLASELEILFAHTPIGIMLVHNDKIMRANPMLAQIFSYRDAKDMLTVSVLTMHENEDSYQKLRNQIGMRLRADAPTEIICSLKRVDGSSFQARLIGRALPFEQFADTTVWMVE
ncbi:MAG: PAS domain-containing protein, partial [Burkholderiaceae bacterium]|nr:PAS domain-containing protein [Burkholderiaceae bacterium]